MQCNSILAIIFCLLLSFTTSAQTRNPYNSIGKNGKILTLTKGEYDEFFDEDSIQRIGSALVNINSMKIVKVQLTKKEQRQLDNSKVSRFLSTDPLTSSYPWYTPYQFAGNTPIMAIDLDGKEVEIKIGSVPNGSTTLRVIGSENVKDVPKKITVPTYPLTVTDRATNTTSTFSVTRDALYINENEKPDKDGNFKVQNIPFEPRKGSSNKYDGEERKQFAKTELPSIRLRQNGSTSLPAEPVNSPLRENQNVAVDVNIHVGGAYTTSSTKPGYVNITGSEGCFTVVGGNSGITSLQKDIDNRQKELADKKLPTNIIIEVEKRKDVPLVVPVPAAKPATSSNTANN